MMRIGIGLLGVLIFISGCSTVNEPKVFQVENTVISNVWPTGSDLPRYRYVGELHGENLSEKKSKASLFEIIVGLVTGKPEALTLKRPYDMYVAPNNIVYVADLGLPGIMVFNLTEKVVTVWNEIDHKTSFQTPVGIVGTENEMLVVDAQLAQVFRFSLDGKRLGSFGKGHLKRPIGIAYDPAKQHVYVSDAALHLVQVFSLTGELLTTIGKHGEALGQFSYPSAIEFDHHKLYVSDTMNARIQIIEPNHLEKEIESFGYRGLNVGNTPRPKGVTVDSDGNVYAVESYFGYLLVYNEQGEFLLPISGKGRDIREFYLPSGVTTDAQDRIYLADTFNGRIVILQYLGD